MFLAFNMVLPIKGIFATVCNPTSFPILYVTGFTVFSRNESTGKF